MDYLFGTVSRHRRSRTGTCWWCLKISVNTFCFFLNLQYLESIAHTPGSERRDSLPVSFNKRKRKRFSIRAAADLTPLGASGKRRSSVSDAGLSVSGSFLDYTASPSFKQESKGKFQIYNLFAIIDSAKQSSEYPFYSGSSRVGRWEKQTNEVQFVHGLVCDGVELCWHIENHCHGKNWEEKTMKCVVFGKLIEFTNISHFFPFLMLCSCSISRWKIWPTHPTLC